MCIERTAALLLSVLLTPVAVAVATLNVVELNMSSPYNIDYSYELNIFDDLFDKLMTQFKKVVEMNIDLRIMRTHEFGQFTVRPPFNPNVSFDMDVGRAVYMDFHTIERASPPYIHLVRNGTFHVSTLYNFSESLISFPFFNYTCSRDNQTYVQFAIIFLQPVLLRVSVSVTLRPVRCANVIAVEFPCFEFHKAVVYNISRKLDTYRKSLTMPLYKWFVERYKPQMVNNLFEEFKRDSKLIYFDYKK